MLTSLVFEIVESPKPPSLFRCSSKALSPQHVPSGRVRSAKSAGDLVQGHTPRIERTRPRLLLDRPLPDPSSGHVKTHVLARREDHEVVGLVVKRVAVNVVDDLVAA